MQTRAIPNEISIIYFKNSEIGDINKIVGQDDSEYHSLVETLNKKLNLTKITLDSCGGSDGKSICLRCGRPGFHPRVGKIPQRRKWQPTPVLLLGKPH